MLRPAVCNAKCLWGGGGGWRCGGGIAKEDQVSYIVEMKVVQFSMC